MKLTPTTAFWNKQYSSSEYGKELLGLVKEFTLKIEELNNKYSEEFSKGLFNSDDCITVFRNLGFLHDQEFIRAVGPRAKDKILMGRLWRLWVICWSLQTSWNIDGDILDLGTYNGKAFFTALKYALLKNKKIKENGRIIIADLFEDPPKEARKVEHGPNLDREVRKLFTNLYPSVDVVKGYIPDSIRDRNVRKVSWCQIDLNSAQADLGSFKYIYPFLEKGAHVIFDDYGAERYHETQRKIDEFLEDKPETVLEIPTMQGLLIKQ